MSSKWLNIKDDEGLEWFYLKLSVLFLWLVTMAIMLPDLSENCPYPVAICRYINFGFMFSVTGKVLLTILLVTLSVLYFLERKMLITLFLQTLLSCIIISYHESNGMHHHATIFTPLFAAQWLAYVIKYFNEGFNLALYRKQFSIQIIAATYALAGISKLNASGWGWINSGELFSIQVVKNYSFQYFYTGTQAYMDKGMQMANTLLQHKAAIQFMLAFSLLLELLCPIILVFRKLQKAYGVGLFLMHVGILVVMSISPGLIMFPMIAFFINPLYLIHKGVKRIAVSKT